MSFDVRDLGRRLFKANEKWRRVCKQDYSGVNVCRERVGNVVNPVQARHMILQAGKSGLPEEEDERGARREREKSWEEVR